MLKHMYYNIPRNLAPLRRWISRFAALLGIVKPPRPEEGAVPDAAADDTGEATGVEALGAEATGAEAAGAPDAAADVIIVVGVEAGWLEAPAVTVTYTMSVTVTALSSPAPDVGAGAAPGREVIVGMLVTWVSAGVDEELEGAPDATGAPVAVAEPNIDVGPTCPCTTSVMMAVRDAKSETATDMASCWAPRSYLVSASAASAVSLEPMSTSMQVV